MRGQDFASTFTSNYLRFLKDGPLKPEDFHFFMQYCYKGQRISYQTSPICILESNLDVMVSEAMIDLQNSANMCPHFFIASTIPIYYLLSVGLMAIELETFDPEFITFQNPTLQFVNEYVSQIPGLQTELEILRDGLLRALERIPGEAKRLEYLRNIIADLEICASEITTTKENVTTNKPLFKFQDVHSYKGGKKIL